MSFNPISFKNTSISVVKEFVRYASKKTGGSTKNTNCKTKPKHRGWKVQDGHNVQAGKMLATQNSTRFHPGLNVGFGRNGTLFAMEAGKVVVTCEKFDPYYGHPWVQRFYGGREGQIIYKKYYNVIPEPQHQRFKLIEEI
ncbi:50S ribosomal protein L27 [Pectinophora gossypiella]|uniref:50S ribosomal protein L27 n=1 Tax=Pectinophora gossypiella TaxID=13191 RepID=UPI00214EFC93|nr:50S ribosomal protein L27 [Pectinophora gossypiella]